MTLILATDTAAILANQTGIMIQAVFGTPLFVALAVILGAVYFLVQSDADNAAIVFVLISIVGTLFITGYIMTIAYVIVILLGVAYVARSIGILGGGN